MPCICIEYSSKAKLPLFVPVIVVLVTLTAVVLVLLRKMSKGEPVEFRRTIPNWIARGLAAELRISRT